MNFIRKLNNLLYYTNLLTEYISALYSYLKAIVIITEKSKSTILVNILSSMEKPFFELMNKIFEIKFIPESSIELTSEFAKYYLNLCRKYNIEINNKNKSITNFLVTVNQYIQTTTNPIVFQVLSLLFQNLNLFHENLDLTIVSDLMMSCLNYIIKTQNVTAVETLIEITNLYPTIKLHANYPYKLISALRKYILTDIGTLLLNLVTFHCSVSGQFNINEIIYIIESFSNLNDKKSLLWPYIYSFFLVLPSDDYYTWQYILSNFHTISFFLDENPSKESTLYIYRVKYILTELFVHLIPSFYILESQNESFYQALLELFYRTIQNSISYLNETTEKLNDHLYSWEKLNSVSCNVLILRNCFLIINATNPFPFSQPTKEFNKEKSFIDYIINLFDIYKNMLIEIDKTESPDEEFYKVLVLTFDMAYRIFQMDTNMDNKRTDNINRNIDSIKETIKSIETKYKEQGVHDLISKLYFNYIEKD